MPTTRRSLIKRFGLVSFASVIAQNALAQSEAAQRALQSANPDFIDQRDKGIAGARWIMVIDLRRCVGCQACTMGCSIENDTPAGSTRTIVREFDVALEGDAAIEEPAGNFILPVLCNHCDNPPCIVVCPVNATFKRPDGPVLIDPTKCIACGACVKICPYHARFMNMKTRTADKCTFCVHRLEKGLKPACVETCVGGARVMGNINDKSSEVYRLLEENSDEIYVLNPEYATAPNVYYLGVKSKFLESIPSNHPLRFPRT